MSVATVEETGEADDAHGAEQLLLHVAGLTKIFGGQRALDRVDLSVRKGRIHALLGENGAGKSTLIKVIAGAQQADAGEIRLSGQVVDLRNPQEARVRGVAVVHQHANLVRSLSVQENLWLGRSLPRRGMGLIDWRAVEHEARKLLERVGLAIGPRAVVETLRPDDVAMISIAKAIASDAKLIILDEPTASLVPQEVSIVLGHMRRLTREGHGFVFVSHRLQEVLDVADDATVLRDGRVVWTGERHQMSRPQLVHAIVGNKKRPEGPNRLPPAPHTLREADAPALQARALSGAGVAGLSLSLHAGEIVGLAGLSGSGAEEAIDLLYGRTRATGGEMRLHGHPMVLGSPRDAVRAGLALVPKDRLAEATIADFSVGRNITIASLAEFVSDPVLRLLRRTREREASVELARQLNVKMPSIDAAISELSGGNQQKAVLARWIGAKARILLLNSPTAAVDVGAKSEIYALLHELAAAGAAILFTSTEMEEFAHVCSRVLVFRDGRVVAELSGEEVTEEAIVAASVGEKS